MVRVVVLGRAEKRAVRRLVEKASVTARTAMSTAKLFAVMSEVDVGGVGDCLVVSVIGKGVSF